MRSYGFAPTEYQANPIPGEPQPTLESAIGEVVLWFQELDEQLATAIAFLLSRGDVVGRIATAELSFKAKVNLLGSLFRDTRPSSEHLGCLSELLSACFEIEQKRNQVVHSRWRSDTGRAESLTRVKFTARGKRGLREQSESLRLQDIVSIGLHCGFLAHSVDELLFEEFGEDYGTL